MNVYLCVSPLWPQFFEPVLENRTNAKYEQLLFATMLVSCFPLLSYKASSDEAQQGFF